ncbi:hypothetical protein PVAP13_4NG043816 [Panicum virgatum]|uniref:Uncharacterized protein n=1 Tax=Panicum virgatum TaxID=38727 RepID=A0A8T0T4V0_PANVG|nr:hypothetical protein PVAP13_4NG043816 [Panicum virgatum]
MICGLATRVTRVCGASLISRTRSHKTDDGAGPSLFASRGLVVTTGQHGQHRRRPTSAAPQQLYGAPRAHTIHLRQRDDTAAAEMPCNWNTSTAAAGRWPGAIVPGLLPLHRPPAVARLRNHAGGGGARAAARLLPAGGRRRARVRGDVPPRVPDPGRVHAVGHPAAHPPLPRPRPGPGHHVRLRRPRPGARRRLPDAVAGAARVPVLQGRVHARHRVPGLVLLGMAGGGHPAVDADAGGEAGERARAVAGEATLRVLEGQPRRLPHSPRAPEMQRLQRPRMECPRLHPELESCNSKRVQRFKNT